MKKFLLLAVAVIVATTSFAQEWSAGLRVGAGLQALGEYKYDANKYVEARFGASWNNPQYGVWRGDDIHVSRVMVDFTALHNWNVLEMDWTPRGGMWFFDAGVGLSVGGRKNYAYVGVTGMARLGFTFNNTPITLALDWSPTFGPAIGYGRAEIAGNVVRYNEVVFNDLGIANIGVSCTYNF